MKPPNAPSPCLTVPSQALTIFLVAICVSFFAVAAKGIEEKRTIRLDLVSSCLNSDECSQFVQLIESAGLTRFLKTEGPFTLLAPTDSAFANLEEEERKALFASENAERAKIFVLSHVLPVDLPTPAELEGNQPTFPDGTLTFTREGNALIVSVAKVTRGPILARNGVVYLVDGFLAEETGDDAGALEGY